MESITMRITSKGQVTIPQEIREKLGLLPDTEVTFEVDRDAVRITKADDTTRSRGRGIVTHMRGRATTRMTTDQIMRLMRG
jgi:AbrB family looped-hinge helix DNA binding protein